jgi:hypothetical protein
MRSESNFSASQDLGSLGGMLVCEENQRLKLRLEEKCE